MVCEFISGNIALKSLLNSYKLLNVFTVSYARLINETNPNNRMFFNPSVYAHTLGGGILLAGALFIVFNFSKLVIKDPYQILVLILLISVATTAHGISHAGLEALYGYNPYYFVTGKTIEPWYVSDCDRK